MANPEVKTPVGDAPVIPLVLLGVGLYLAWFSIHYWRSGVAWPTTPVKSVLTGGTIPDAKPPTSIAASLTADVTAIQGGSSSGPGQAGTTPTGGGTVRGTYTQPQLAQLWIQCGGSPKTAEFAARVAEAESSGRADVTSRNPDGGTNVGLYQLDTRGVGVGHTIAQLQDPVTNTQITVLATGNGHNWSAWANPVTNALPGHQFGG